MERSRRMMRRVLFPAAGTVVLGLALCTLNHAANITFGVDLTLYFVQATKQGTNVEVDEKIPKGVKSELFRNFGSKYKKYTLLNSEERMLHMSRNEEYDLPNGRGQMTVRVTGYKQLWIMFLVTHNGNGQAFKVSHNCYYTLNYGPEAEPLIVVFFAKEVQVSN